MSNYRSLNDAGRPMPNIGALLKQEIARLARREVRGETKITKKATVQYRHDIAALKRRVSALERAIVSSLHAATAKPPDGKPPSNGKQGSSQRAKGPNVVVWGFRQKATRAWSA